MKCPYLGLRDDPSTALDFPSDGNTCHRAQSKPAVNREYQQAVCLSAEHIACPIFLGKEEGPLPAGLAAPSNRFTQPSRLFWLAIPVLIILAGSTLSILSPGRLRSLIAQSLAAWKTIDFSKIFSLDMGNNAEEISGAPTLSDFNSRPSQNGATPSQESLSPFDEIISPVAPDPSLVPCKPPPGWVVYTVKPTDSLFRLSLVYGVHIADLQMVNCMANNSVIRPGDIIYVPGPSSTASMGVTALAPQTATPTPRPNAPLPAPTRTSRSQPARPPQTATRPAASTATPKPSNTPAPRPTDTRPPPPTQTPAPTAIPTKPPIATPTSAPPLQ